jgi:hypothetical protein
VAARFDGVLLAAAMLAACRAPAVTQDAAPPEAVDASIAATAPPRESTDARDASPPARDGGDSARPVVRTRGEISARFAPEKARYLLGEPMLLDLEVSNTSREPLEFDDRVWRYTWSVRSERDEVLCETRSKGGRIGSGFFRRIRLEPGEIHRDTLLLNAFCGSFAEAGRYLVSMTRSLAHDNAFPTDAACDDFDPRHPDAGGDPACADGGTAPPAVASRFWIEIAAWDAAALRARLATFNEERLAAARAHDYYRDGALTAYGDWFCDHVRCDCPPTWNRWDHWLEKAIARVPEQMGAHCRRR